MKAGINTPQSVLRFIDAIWEKHRPADPLELARELNLSPKRYRRLKEKWGDGLVAHLEAMKRDRLEQPRFPAKQNGLLNPPQYVGTVHGAIDDVESVPPEYQARLSREAEAESAILAVRHRLRVEKLREERRLANYRSKGKPTTLVEAQIRRISARLRDAA